MNELVLKSTHRISVQFIAKRHSHIWDKAAWAMVAALTLSSKLLSSKVLWFPETCKQGQICQNCTTKLRVKGKSCRRMWGWAISCPPLPAEWLPPFGPQASARRMLSIWPATCNLHQLKLRQADWDEDQSCLMKYRSKVGVIPRRQLLLKGSLLMWVILHAARPAPSKVTVDHVLFTM